MSAEIKRITINLLRKDKDVLQKLAELEGEPLSVFIRSILRREIKLSNTTQPCDSIVNYQGTITCDGHEE